MVQARAIPAAQAPPAFAFIVTQYLLFLGAALALRRSEAAGGLAPALVGVNAATHLVATLMVLGNVYLMGIGGYALWPVPAGLLGLAAWWAAARRDPDTRLGTAFVGSALGLGVLGMLAAQSGRALPPHAAWVFGGMFVGSSLAWLALRRDLERLGAYAGVVPVLGNALALFPLILGALGERQLSGVALGAAAALLMAAYHAGVARLLLRPAQEETRFQALLRLAHYGLAATFVAVAMPLQLRGDYERAHLALAWSVEAAALVWAGLAARDARVRSWGYVLLAVAAGKAALVDLPLLSPGPGFWPFLNERGLAGGSIVAAAGVSAFLLARRSKELTEPEKALPQVLTVLANVFALLFGSVDLYHWAGDRWPRSPLGSAPQLSLSLYWTVYALGAAGAGIWRRNRPVRLLAVGLLYVSAIKVFLFDLAGLETPYRIVSFLVLGIVLLLVSLLYTRFEERFSSPPEES